MSGEGRVPAPRRTLSMAPSKGRLRPPSKAAMSVQQVLALTPAGASLSSGATSPSSLAAAGAGVALTTMSASSSRYQ
eukprot:4497550-Pyramimonas_sp.AAC.1